MAARFGKLDPFLDLPPRVLLQTWLVTVSALHGIGVVGTLLRDGSTLAYHLTVCVVFGAVAASPSPALKVLALAGWLIWWLERWLRSPFSDLYLIATMMLSAYVLARAVIAWARDGHDSLRSGWRDRPGDDWPELGELSRKEGRLVMTRALRGTPGLGRALIRHGLVLTPIIVALTVFEIYYLSPPGSDSNGLPPPRSQHITELILPLLAAAALHRRTDSIREILRGRILPEFWQQPWLWDRARREALKGRTA